MPGQDKEKIKKIHELCEKIDFLNTQYSILKWKTYYSYDDVIELLEKTIDKISETARTPRPLNLPGQMAWSEKFYDPDNEFDPFVFDGSMSVEDFSRASDEHLDDMEREL